ncbi:MAG TPA: hypothetical protein DD671_07775, partial [Balneolaceae bacterium]|nr:hypothetical protein [Balneolaceae bacterium]
KKAARSVKTIDSHLLKALKRDLSSESYSAIKAQLDKTGDLSLSQKKKIASEFVNALEQDLHSHDPNLKHQQLGLFQFLDHLDAHHIKQLLYGEDRNTCALLFDYLPEQKTARVIDWLDKSRVTEIMIGMSNLHELSYNDHKEISSRLFSKAMDILEVDKELKQGAKNILRILDQLPLEDQNKYIEQLKATGSPVADVIANKFITLEQIPRLNDLMLKEALAPISTEVLLEAVSDLSESITNKLLSVRPKREQRLIRMELQQMEYIKDEKSEQAKLQIMKAIREIA